MNRLLVLLGISLGTCGMSQLLASEAVVHLIHLDPQPSITGGCPARVHFTGHIEATGALDVTYEWRRSDGSSTEHTLSFRRPGSLPVATDWHLNKTTDGWMQLVVVSPKRMQTAKAMFTVHCGR